MSSKTKDKPETSLVDEFITLRPSFERNTDKFEALISTLIEQEKINVHSITARTKEVPSLAKKISDNPDHYRQLADVTDISGVRVICYFAGEVDRVARLIEEDFDVISELSVDKRKTIDPDRFGYLSVHYIVRLGKDRAKLPEYKRFEEHKCEIQIRSILQHAWAEIEHDLGYKAAYEIPKQLRRRFSRVAAILESVDREFNEIRAKLEEYSNEVPEKIKSEPRDVTIDKISLTHYILTSELISDIDSRLANLAKRKISKEVEIDVLLKLCNFLGINSIQGLDKLLEKEKVTLFNFARIWFVQQYKKRPVPARPLKMGVSIGFLGHVLATEKGDLETVVEYLNSLGIGGLESTKIENAKALIETGKILESHGQ